MSAASTTRAGGALPSVVLLDARSRKEADALAVALARSLRERYSVVLKKDSIAVWTYRAASELPSTVATIKSVVPSVVLVTNAGAAKACLDASIGVPILFAVQEDPRLVGLTSNLERPNINCTGMWNSIELHCKRLELLRMLAPQCRRIGVVVDHYGPRRDEAAREIEQCPVAGHEVSLIEIGTKLDIEALPALVRQRFDGLLIPHSDAASRWWRELTSAVNRSALPAVFDNDRLIDVGALASLEPVELDPVPVFARMLGHVLSGVPVNQIPVERPRTTRTSINLDTARRLRLSVHSSVLKRADRVVGA